jgi:uncharacterized protein YaiE (UPF0345 family)
MKTSSMKTRIYLLMALTLQSFTAMTFAQNIPNYLPTNGLVGWYPFNGNANDESLLGTSGTITNATLSEDRFNNQNNAYYFNGVNAIIDLGVNTSINSINSELTFSYWVKPDGNSPSASMTVLASYAGQSGSGAYWRFISRIDRSTLNAKLDLMINTVWNSINSNQNIIIANQWNHVAHTRSGNLGKTYINGILSNTSNISSQIINTPSTPGATTKIGFNWPSFGNNEWFKGNIDDIGFWNRELTSQEITEIYSANSNITNSTLNTATTIPGAISYQAVARNEQGQALTNATIQVKFTLITDSINGTAEFSEWQSLTTNSMGLFNTSFGTGNAINGNFDSISWTLGKKFLKVEMDAGNGYVFIGTQEMLAVPFCFHSGTAGTIKNPGLPIFSDNTAALAGGLTIGEMYRTEFGDLKVVY